MVVALLPGRERGANQVRPDAGSVCDAETTDNHAEYKTAEVSHARV